MAVVIQKGALAWAKDVATKAFQIPFGNPVAYPSVAEAKDVKFGKIEEVQNATGRVLRLDGLVFHSALAVAGVSHRQEGNALVVEVALSPLTSGRSGSFAVELPLSDSTWKVLFGPERSLIWQVQWR